MARSPRAPTRSIITYVKNLDVRAPRKEECCLNGALPSAGRHRFCAHSQAPDAALRWSRPQPLRVCAQER
jgi:hypothetical protein